MFCQRRGRAHKQSNTLRTQVFIAQLWMACLGACIPLFGCYLVVFFCHLCCMPLASRDLSRGHADGVD